VSARAFLLFLYGHAQKRLNGNHACEPVKTKQQETETRDNSVQLRLHQLEGNCGFMKARSLFFDLAGLKPDGPTNVLPETQDIWIEGDPKTTMIEMGDGVRLVRVGHVLGILYRAGGQDLRWRDPRKIWGRVTGETIQKMANQHIRIRHTAKLQ
jgi:hypothetical protein